MDENIALRLSGELRISKYQIIREFWEMMILSEISQNPLGNSLIFTGGTALRLAYNSPRFSDDLDFYLKKNITASFFEKEMGKIAKNLNIIITDLKSKYYTNLAEFKISESYIRMPFKIKIEIRKKIIRTGFELRLLGSPASNLQVLLHVITLKKIELFKKQALKDRKEPRDLFDLWFISQQLKIPFKKPGTILDAKYVKQNLNKYLPLKYQQIIKELVS